MIVFTGRLRVKKMYEMLVLFFVSVNGVYAMEKEEKTDIKTLKEMVEDKTFYCYRLPINLQEEIEVYVKRHQDKFKNWLFSQIPERQLEYMGSEINSFEDNGESNDYMLVNSQQFRKIFDLKRACTLEYLGDTISGYRVSSDEQYISVTRNFLDDIFNLKTQKKVNCSVLSMFNSKFSPDGKYVYSNYNADVSKAVLLNLKKKEKFELTYGMSDIEFAPNSRYALLYKAGDCGGIVFDLEAKSSLDVKYEGLHTQDSIFSPKGNYYWYTRENGIKKQKSYVYDFTNKTELEWLGDDVDKIVFDPHELYIFACHNECCSIELFNLKTKEKIDFDGDNFYKLSLSPHGNYLFIQYNKTREYKGKIFTFPFLDELNIDGEKSIISFRLDDRYLHVTYRNNGTKTFDLKNKIELSNEINYLDLNPNQKHTLYGYKDKVEIIDNTSMTILKTYDHGLSKVHYDSNGNMYFLRDGKMYKILLDADELLDERSFEELKLIEKVYQKCNELPIELDNGQHEVLKKLPENLQEALHKLVTLKSEQKNQD